MNELRHWIIRLLHCESLEDFREVLTRWNQETQFTLCDQSIVSAVYTPRVLKLLQNREDKAVWLEELAILCWRPRT